MEENGADVVEMAIQREEASPCLVAPDLDLVVVAATHKQRLRLVEVDAANWAIVLFKSINQSSHAVVPELNSRRM